MILFTLILLGPLVARGLTTELSGFILALIDVTGLLGVSALAIVLVLGARVKSITRVFGFQIIMVMHRFFGLLAAFLIVAHVVFVIVDDPNNIILLTPFAPGRAIAGMSGLLAVCVLVALAVFGSRRRYEQWRWRHILFTVVLIAATVTHIVLLNHMIKNPYEGTVLGALAGFVLMVLLIRWIAVPLNPRGSFVVIGMHNETEDVTTLILRPRRKNRAPILFAPGQFAWVRLRRFPGAEHPFTISSAAQYATRPTFTFKRKGDWTEKRLLKLEPGDQVWLDGPHGAMTPEPEVTELVLIAGGVGISPIMSILRTMALSRDGRPVKLFLADRPGEMLFRQELRSIQELLNIIVIETHQVRITAEFLIESLPATFDRKRADYFICGAPILVNDTTESLAEFDVPLSRIHTELFGIL
jgi:predicted ferric reductase